MIFCRRGLPGSRAPGEDGITGSSMEFSNYCALKMLKEAGRYPCYFFVISIDGRFSHVMFTFPFVLQVHTYIKPEYHNLPRQKLAPDIC